MKSSRIYADGYFTVEASFIFPIMLMVIAAVLRLGMEVHDDMAYTALTQYLDIKNKSIQQSCYSPHEHKTDIHEVVNTGIVEFSSIKKELNKLYAEELVREYGNSIMLFDRLDIEGGKTWGSKNSTIVRSIHVIKSHAERIPVND